jgi:hypothetical protein
LKFDLSSVAGRQIDAAILRLYVVEGSRSGGRIAQLSSDGWSESSVTWNSAPALGARTGPIGPVAAGRWVSIDVTPLFAGGATGGLAILNRSTDQVRYGSSESTRVPELVVQVAG